jgi:hypothetical protein
VWRTSPCHGQETISHAATDTLAYAKYTGGIESEVTTRT